MFHKCFGKRCTRGLFPFVHSIGGSTRIRVFVNILPLFGQNLALMLDNLSHPPDMYRCRLCLALLPFYRKPVHKHHHPAMCGLRYGCGDCEGDVEMGSRQAVLTQKKKSRPERGNFKRARGQYMSSPRCSQLFNHESLAPNWSQHTTI